MITSTTNLAKELLRLEREISGYACQKTKSKKDSDKEVWQRKIDALRIELREVRQEIDKL